MSLKINILQENINSLKVNYIPLGNVKKKYSTSFNFEQVVFLKKIHVYHIFNFYSSKKLKEGPNPIEFLIPIGSNKLR